MLPKNSKSAVQLSLKRMKIFEKQSEKERREYLPKDIFKRIDIDLYREKCARIRSD